jgi:hypothetical protein
VFGKTDNTRLVPAAQPSGSTRPASDPSMDLTNHSQFHQPPQGSKSIKVSIHLCFFNHLIALSNYNSSIDIDLLWLFLEVNGSYLNVMAEGREPQGSCLIGP